MAVQKTEADEADLQEAYDRARRVGLFLVEKYARSLLRQQSWLKEFVMAGGRFYFLTDTGQVAHANECSALARHIASWDVLKLTGEPMRFTADGPVRREW